MGFQTCHTGVFNASCQFGQPNLHEISVDTAFVFVVDEYHERAKTTE